MRQSWAVRKTGCEKCKNIIKYWSNVQTASKKKLGCVKEKKKEIHFTFLTAFGENPDVKAILCGMIISTPQLPIWKDFEVKNLFLPKKKFFAQRKSFTARHLPGTRAFLCYYCCSPYPKYSLDHWPTKITYG